MSEPNTENQPAETPASAQPSAVKLEGLVAIKKGMSTYYRENGEVVPVTVCKYEPLVISQVKTPEKDGYVAVQVAGLPKSAKNSVAPATGHLKGSGFDSGAYLIQEVRQSQLPEGAAKGARVAIDSLVKGDRVKVTGRSKGRGFSGVVRRWNFGGGPGSHGSDFHRAPGSMGNRTWPGRVMPGKKLPGRYGYETVTVRNLEVVDVLPEDNAILIKGAIPGPVGSPVKIMKV